MSGQAEGKASWGSVVTTRQVETVPYKDAVLQYLHEANGVYLVTGLANSLRLQANLQ